MKAGWEVKSLDQVAIITNGGTPKSGTAEFWGGNVEWLTPKDMGKLESEFISETPRKISELGLSKCSAKLVPENSVIMSTRAPIGHLAINTVPMAFNQGCRGLAPTDVLKTKFLFYYLGANIPELNDLGTGATFKELSSGALKSFPIPLPPLDEQKRIVAVLDAAFDGLARARANVEANLQNARELFDSFTREAISNVSCNCLIVELSDVAEITSGLVDPKEDQYQGLLHVGAGNMITGSDKLENVQSARDEKLISGKHTFDRTMVLYSKIRPYLKKAARPMFDGLCSADVYPLKPVDGVLDRNFLFHLLLAPDFTEYAKSGSDRVGMPKVNRKHLFNYKFRLPSFEEQVQVATKIDGVMKTTDTLVSRYQSKLADLKHRAQIVNRGIPF